MKKLYTKIFRNFALLLALLLLLIISVLGFYFTKVLVKQLPVVIAIVSLFILVAFFVKRTAAYNAITIVTPIVYSLIAVTFYEIKVTKDFAEKTLLRYEVGYMFNRLADKCSYTYRNQCIIASLLISIAALFMAYVLFTKKEID